MSAQYDEWIWRPHTVLWPLHLARVLPKLSHTNTSTVILSDCPPSTSVHVRLSSVFVLRDFLEKLAIFVESESTATGLSPGLEVRA